MFSAFPRFFFSAALFAAPLTCVLRAQPAPPAGTMLLPESALPAYEAALDHAAFIRGWNKASLARGEKIFQRVCHDCHGDLNLRGSLPDALAFASGKFQHGADPLTMYRTITRGWRLMPPQVQLVPQEKYDVIHYLRETFLAPHNPAQLTPVTEAYLASLPSGRERGPAPTLHEPWREMDYGRSLIATVEIADDANRREALARPAAQRDAVPSGANIAYKAINLRLDPGPGGVAAGKAWVAFEHDTLRPAGGWTGEGFIDWEGINFNTRHVVRPRTVGTPLFQLADGPGWADPATGRFDDPRVVGLDGRRFGPLPRPWARYLGLHRHPDRTVLRYTVGPTAILESHDLESLGGQPVFVRTLNVARSDRDLLLRVAATGPAVAVSGLPATALETAAGETRLRIRASATPVRLALRLAAPGTAGPAWSALAAPPPLDLAPFTRGAPAQWKDTVTTTVVRGPAQAGFAWDRLPLPLANPWRARVRPSGVDFLPSGDAAVLCTWDGDVWRVDGLRAADGVLTWRRIASGLFQPLGLKLRGDAIFVTCRDQLVELRDLDGDGETDFYACHNSDHQVTEHFHEFAMGLQTDAAGNFYYAKSARHARTPLVPHHGTLLKISADGSATEILAHGFRAANGVCLNDDGSFFVTDQEGHWMPMNRINRVVRGGFYGNMWSYGAPADTADSAMAPPFCWIDKAFDRSPGELVRIAGAPWGELRGAVLNLSYGRGRIELVLPDASGAAAHGAISPLPLPDFPTGIMRARFHPETAELYACGLSAWATSQTLQEGGFYRLRRTGAPVHVPTGWRARPDGLDVTFSDPLDPVIARDPARYTFTRWDLKRSANYGSPRIDERPLPVTAATLLPDGRTVRLTLPSLAPAQIFELTCQLATATHAPFTRTLHGTLLALPSRE